ncbi:unnamed protein product [Acanthocheilonema viteae]|uniref:Uncharacterized protein n=1 Tax=Acanthocheilonema viteae TaxID=6277 RepID=A0A498SQU3_ACAVI|nr:unnamed protein product [Acanthocheilonema viteae]
MQQAGKNFTLISSSGMFSSFKSASSSTLMLNCIVKLKFVNSFLNEKEKTQSEVVTKLTVYENGAIEAECNKLPCGTSGAHCNDNQASCRAETDTFSSMKWASNGQSILQRCCTITVPRKIYIGTDLVSLGSYYTGGIVDQKDRYSKEGPEFDFISNVRTEQGGVRIWVYRVICPKATGISGGPAATSHGRDIAATEKTLSTVSFHTALLSASSKTLKSCGKPARTHSQATNSAGNAQSESVPTAYKPINPLQYRPPNWRMTQRDSPVRVNSRDLFERLI